MKFNEGDIVKIRELKDSINAWQGTIVGIATTEQPFIGNIWIVDLQWPISVEYPYSCLVVPESNLVLVQKVKG